MVRYSSYVTPDMRLRRIQDQTQREVQRKQELAQFEQRRTQEIQAEMEQERTRGTQLDQAQSVNTEMEAERARGLELDEKMARFREVEQRQQPSARPTFEPSPSPFGRFVDRLETRVPTPPEVRQDPMGVSLQRKARTGEPLTPEELDAALKKGYNISYSTGQPRIGIDPTPAQEEALTRGISPESPEFPAFDIGAPAGEPPFPGIAGKIPGLRTPAELGATIGTLGVGGPLIGPATAVTGSGGAFVGGKVAEEVGVPPFVGELVGGLGGGFAGGMAVRPAVGAARKAITSPQLRRTLAAEAGGLDPHIAKGDPGPPPKEPPTGRLTPDDPEFDGILEAALKGEKPGETLVRRHQGVINTETRIAANAAEDVNNLLVDAGLGRRFRQSVVAKEEGAFDELNRLLHNPTKVTSGEMAVPERLRPIYDELRAQTDWEQAARVDFDPDQALVEDYFFRGWQPPEGMFTGEARGALGRSPAFRLPRVNATYDEMIEAGFRPLFENPAEQARFSRLMGIKYREQMKLIDKIKAKELALPHTGGTVPEGWRVPRVGSAFEGKPYAAPGGGVAFTRRWAVPDSLANRLENVYGVTPKLGKGEIFGKIVDFQKAVDAAVFLPKRAKLIGSVFQHVDFLGRSHVGAWTGFVDAVRRGQPVAAVTHLAKWPKSAVDIVRSTFSPGFRSRLSRLAVDDTPLWKGRRISNKMISEEGLSLRDETIFPELDKVIAEVRAEPRIVQMGKAPFRLLADLERAWRNGLFKGVYPAATLSDIKNNIGPMIMRQHPDLPDRQLAGMIAKQANASYSTIPAGMSVVQNQQARWFLTRFLFSLNEQEGLLRAFTGAIRGENAAYFRTRLLGTYLGVIALANTIHFASTGEPLPISRYTPISKDKWGPLPFGYNTDFAAPNIPLTGRSGVQVTIDLMGQMDTAFRTLDPKSFLSARYSVPVRAGVSQATGKDFFGAPIDTVGPGGIFSRTAQLAQDLFAPIGPGQAGLELLRSNIEETEGLIQPGEARLGTTGLGVQATGINLRAETTPQLLDRIRGEVMREKGIEGSYEDIKATDSPRANEIDDEVEVRIGQELELRRETAKLRGQTTPQGQGFEAIEATREVQQTEQLDDDANLNSGQWSGDAWREKYRDRQRDFFNRREQIKADFQIEFDDKEAPSGSVNAAIDAYFDVNVDDFAQPDGEVDWDGFFKARDTALKGLSSGDRRRVMEFIRKFDTPTVTEFRKAQGVVDKLFDTPKYKGLTLKEGEELDEFVNVSVGDFQRDFLRRTRRELSRVVAMILAAKELGISSKILRFAMLFRRGRVRDVFLDPRRDEMLQSNQVILAKFYPDLLERQLSREEEAALGEEAFAGIAR